MKKLSVLTAAALTFAAVVPVTASADPAEGYNPTFYMTSADDNTDPKTGDVVLLKKDIPEEGSLLKFNLYVSDKSKQLWWLSPKWKCAEPLVTLTDINDPNITNELFAYSVLNPDGTQNFDKVSAITAHDETYNTMGFTTTVGLSLKPLTPYSEKTDDLPLTWFTANVSSELPCGYYDIYFLTSPEDYPDQQYTKAFFRLDNSDSERCDPILEGITIRISGTEGDVDGDGSIDSTDASLILTEYAAIQTTGETTFDAAAAFAADVDHDRVIDASDASTVLSYYAYVMSTEEEPMEFLDFMAEEDK